MIAVYAAVAMVLSDVLGTLLTQAQARDRAVLAGWLDTAGWLVAIFTTSWSVAAVNGHDLTRKLAVLGAVSLANFAGSWLGVQIGRRFVTASVPLASRVADVEARVARLEEQ